MNCFIFGMPVRRRRTECEFTVFCYDRFFSRSCLANCKQFGGLLFVVFDMWMRQTFTTRDKKNPFAKVPER